MKLFAFLSENLILTGEGERPLLRICRATLVKLRPRLVQKIEMECSFELTGLLLSKGVISEANKQLIEGQRNCVRRCEVLLDIMARKSNFLTKLSVQNLPKDSKDCK